MNPLHTLPKAELHLHIEGALEPELAFRLARRNGVTLPYGSVEELRRRYDFDSLQSFLDVYYANMAALCTAADFRDLTVACLEQAQAQGVRHVELFFDPQMHTSRGVGFDEVVDGLRDGLADAYRRYGITGGLIVCIVRDRPVSEAVELIERAASRRDDLIGLGLDSAEVGYPPQLFTDVFARAAELGLRLVAHAGEEAGPDYIRSALDDLHVERIDHGIRSLEDPELVSRLVREQVPLTVCPLSNVALGCVADLSAHPFHELLDARLRVSVHSDDPAYFGGYVGDNFTALRDTVKLSDEQAVALARESITASFASEERKATLLAELDSWAGA